MNQDFFLSVLLRTQARRLHALEEVLTCLMSQEFQNFEVLLLCHNVDKDNRENLAVLISSYPEYFTKRITMTDVSGGTRSKPLNIGLGLSSGKYFVQLDDDDLVMKHWTSDFYDLYQKKPGAILRTLAVRQNTEYQNGDARRSPYAVGRFEDIYSKEFTFLSNAKQNVCPNMTIAFPLDSIRELEYEFDESLNSQEDWDFLMRCAARLPVSESKNVTAIYRWNTNSESSRTEHGQLLWENDSHYILHKLNASDVHLTQGWLSDFHPYLNVDSLFDPISKVNPDLEIYLIVNSQAWKLFALPRFLTRVALRKRKVDFIDVFFMSNLEKITYLQILKVSRLYRLGCKLINLIKRLS